MLRQEPPGEALWAPVSLAGISVLTGPKLPKQKPTEAPAITAPPGKERGTGRGSNIQHQLCQAPFTPTAAQRSPAHAPGGHQQPSQFLHTPEHHRVPNLQHRTGCSVPYSTEQLIRYEI